MSAASLIPEYYNNKVKVAIFLAPPAAMALNPQAILQAVSKQIIMDVVGKAEDLLGLWDIIPHDFLTTDAGFIFCKLFNGKICNLIIGHTMDFDPTYDDPGRYDVVMS
jgi:hypothetical protein